VRLAGAAQRARRSTASYRRLANVDAAEKWFAENDPEGVAFEYEVLE
jgi:hypothetical protein